MDCDGLGKSCEKVSELWFFFFFFFPFVFSFHCFEGHLAELVQLLL